MNFLISCWIGMLILTVSCKPLEYGMKESKKYVSFGELGGFAGKYEEYRLFRDGKVVRITSIDKKRETMASLSTKQTDQLFALVGELGEKYEGVNNPGNLTHFLKLISNGTDQISFVWGRGLEPINQEINDVYNLLQQLCRDKYPIM